MRSLDDRTVVVFGGTGNVGSHVVRALLERGATVVVPSRSDDSLRSLREHLTGHLGEGGLAGFRPLVGDIAVEAEGTQLRKRITEEAGVPNAIVAALGDYVATPSLLEATREQLGRALDTSVVAHFQAARTFTPLLMEAGGTYIFVQGPLAFGLWPGSGGDLVSIATAGQHMLFRAVAQELSGSPARVLELVTYAFIRDRQTQPGSPLTGEAVGAYTAHLVTGDGSGRHGETIHLREPEQLAEVGLA
jgi:NAD(P)-dependent dehydrogenase (short-subunit alcohol dehydrogenase family)